MTRTVLQAKLHQVRVTHADFDYEGSCGIDELLLEASGIREGQDIEILNMSNGERFSTRVIKAARGSGQISLKGAVARKARVGDRLIISAYAEVTDKEFASWSPVIVLVDDGNRARLPPIRSRPVDRELIG